jgi:prolyl-tRNA synthetase
VKDLLHKIQDNLYKKAIDFRKKNTFQANSKKEFIKLIETGGFVYAHWDGTSETEELIKKLTKATIRCLPLDAKNELGTCLFSGNPSKKRVLFAKNY